jgi:hypothetical protein
MRLGQAHRAGPGAGHQRLQEHLLLPVLAVGLQRLDRAVRQHREVAPGQVGGIDHLGQDRADHRRHALAAVLRRIGQAGPAAFHELVEGLLEAGRRCDVAGGLVVGTADLVADLVERGQHGFGEARGFVQHGIDQFAVDVGLAQAGEQRFRAEYVVEGEAQIVQRGLVGAHAALPVMTGRRSARGNASILRRMVCRNPSGNRAPHPQRSTPGRPGTGASALLRSIL